MATTPTSNRHEEVIGVDFDISKARANLGILQQAVDALKASVGAGGGGIPVALPGVAGVGAGLGGGGTVQSGAIHAPGAPGQPAVAGMAQAASQSATMPSGAMPGHAPPTTGGMGPPQPGVPPMPGQPHRVATPYWQYMAGTGFSADARMLAGGVFSGRPIQGAVSMGASMFGQSIIDTAKSRADMIEDMRRSGTPGMLPTMGALRFAGPAAAIATAVGSAIVGQIDEGMDLQEQYSTKRARMGRDMAMIRSSGGFRWGNESPDGTRQRDLAKIDPSTGWAGRDTVLGAAAQYGIAPDEAFRQMRALSSAGFRDTAMSHETMFQLTNTGVSADVVAAFRANARLRGGQDSGASGTGGEAQWGLIGTAQAAGLRGSGVDALLSQIANHTKQLAMKGIRVDTDDIRKIMERGVQSGVPLEPLMAGVENLSGVASRLKKRFQSPFEAYGEAILTQSALREGGSIEGAIGVAEDWERSPSSIIEKLRGARGEAGRIAVSGLTGMSIRQDIRGMKPSWMEQIPESAQEFLRGIIRQPISLEKEDPEAMRRASAHAIREATREGRVQDADTYWGWIRRKAGSDRSMGTGEFVNDALNTIAGSMDDMKNVMVTVMEQTQQTIENLPQAITNAWMDAFRSMGMK